MCSYLSFKMHISRSWFSKICLRCRELVAKIATDVHGFRGHEGHDTNQWDTQVAGTSIDDDGPRRQLTVHARNRLDRSGGNRAVECICLRIWTIVCIVCTVCVNSCLPHSWIPLLVCNLQCTTSVTNARNVVICIYSNTPRRATLLSHMFVQFAPPSPRNTTSTQHLFVRRECARDERAPVICAV